MQKNRDLTSGSLDLGYLLSHLLLHLSGNGLTIQQLIMLFFHIIDCLLLINV